jgi:ribosomal protein L34
VSINPLKPEERERRKKVGWVVRDTTFNGGGRRKAMFAAMKVPRQCPLVLLVKVSWIGVKARLNVI